MATVQIITPSGMFGASADDDALDTALRVIGVAFGSDDEWASKYGTNYENDVFMMNRYCWCERSDCPWCAGCSCKTEHQEPKCDWCRGIHKWADKGALPPDDPPHYGSPHFWFKPSGFRLWWYKYIGRDPQIHGDLPADFMQQIFATHPAGMTIEQAFEKFTKGEEESAAAFQAMFARLNVKTA